MYALYLYYLGLSFRSTAKALDPFLEKRSHVAVWNWVQLFNPNKLYLKRTRVTAFIIDETMLQIGSDYAWLLVPVESVDRQILGVYISRHRNMLVDESFLRTLIAIYGKRTVYSDGGTWYPEACSSLGLRQDIFGDAYEYLLAEFADETKKKGGEFFTPREVVRLLVSLVEPKEGMIICDPTCGSGGMLIESRKYVERTGGNPRDLVLEGQESNYGTTSTVCSLNFLLTLFDFKNIL